jgi:ABC-2 type transport system permease protein
MTSAAGLAGTRRLVGLAVRRDRVRLGAWILGLALFVGATAALFVDDLARQVDVVRETRLVTANAGMRMIGITSGPSVGGYLLHREFVSLAALAAILSVTTVVRHTRQDEELGRSELIGAAVVGRYAALLAAVVVAVGADLVLAVSLGLAMMAAGLPVGASLLAGASVAAVGVAFVGVAAVTVQLGSTSRSATGLAAGVLGASFLLSGVGNMLGTVDEAGLRVDSAWPAWLSPIGWGQQARPFGDALWWPLTFSVLLCAGLLVSAIALLRRRDSGLGLLPQRRGRAHASWALLGTTGLAWRLQRSAWLGWAVGLTVFGLILGSLTEQIQDVTGQTRDFYLEMGGSSSIVPGYQTSIISMAGMFVAIYVVQVLLRLRVDESGATLETVLATGVSRQRWLLGHLAAATAGAGGLLLLFALGMTVASAPLLGDPAGLAADLTLAAAVQLPAVLVVAGVVVALVGLVPRHAASTSWTLFVAFLVVGPMFGPGLGLPARVQDLSPFTHVPKVPAVDPAVGPLVALAAVCLALGVAGLVALRRRDLVLTA